MQLKELKPTSYQFQANWAIVDDYNDVICVAYDEDTIKRIKEKVFFSDTCKIIQVAEARAKLFK